MVSKEKVSVLTFYIFFLNNAETPFSSKTLVSTAMSTRRADLDSIKLTHALVHQLAALGVGKLVAARPQLLSPPAGGGLAFGGRTGLFRFHRTNSSTSAGILKQFSISEAYSLDGSIAL